jgi:hypothetical protein
LRESAIQIIEEEKVEEKEELTVQSDVEEV